MAKNLRFGSLTTMSSVRGPQHCASTSLALERSIRIARISKSGRLQRTHVSVDVQMPGMKVATQSHTSRAAGRGFPSFHYRLTTTKASRRRAMQAVLSRS